MKMTMNIGKSIAVLLSLGGLCAFGGDAVAVTAPSGAQQDAATNIVQTVSNALASRVETGSAQVSAGRADDKVVSASAATETEKKASNAVNGSATAKSASVKSPNDKLSVPASRGLSALFW